MTNPYELLPSHAFWRLAVAEVGPHGLSRLWTPQFEIAPADKIVTAGSCFAQHIGRALAERGYRWLDAEPAPPWIRGDDARAFNYGIFSFRTGNIYTPKMLLQWLRLAFSDAETGEIWEADGRWYDPLRPVIEPEGFASREELIDARRATLASIRGAVREAQVFIFTLGLTESWRNAATGMEYALCPGTIAGDDFDAEKHKFHNASVSEIGDDLDAALTLMRSENEKLNVLLTVSPVPLIASASGEHVLIATSHSKAVLRAVAGEAAKRNAWVDYFPSYEIITQPVFRGMFYGPNMRSVEPAGIATVMEHFFTEQARAFGEQQVATEPEIGKPKKSKRRTKANSDVKCEEELLDAFTK